MLAPFLHRVARVRVVQERPTHVVLIPLEIGQQKPPPPAAPTERVRTTRPIAPKAERRPAQATPEVAPITLPPQEPARAPSDNNAGATAAAPAASAPLQLGPAVIREAHRASKGAARRMAEASGADLDDNAVSRQERLAESVERTAKPDCLRAGSSLLSVFVVAYELFSDRCK
ncbi:MAG: hypothetical protein U1E89_17080 [Burkholderiaceae bacterium]